MENNILDSRVFLSWTEKQYPAFPYERQQSHIYKALQRLFMLWGLDQENPFKEYVRAGETALIKPNWVRDFNPKGYNLDSLISHSSVIKHLIDFLALAMDGRGTIVIADAPLQNCDFDNLIKMSRISETIELARQTYPKIEFVLEDWRLTMIPRLNWLTSWKPGPTQSSKDDFGKQAIHTHQVFDLGQKSFLEDIAQFSDRFRVTCYKPSLMKLHHACGKHEYLIAKRVFDVDFMINLSKMKTHIKAGLTGALKSLIGINGHKEYLPHHIKGPYFKGGDNYCLPNWFRERYEDIYDYYWEHFAEFPILKRKGLSLVLQIFWKASLLFGSEHISASSWRGNETIWRTTLDLNHLFYFMSPKRPRKILNIVDGIIAGEGEGPLSPTPKHVGLLMGGENPAYIDAVMAKLMGYNISRIPTVYHAIYHRKSLFAGPDLQNYSIQSAKDSGSTETIAFCDLPNLQFEKPYYWRGV